MTVLSLQTSTSTERDKLCPEEEDVELRPSTKTSDYDTLNRETEEQEDLVIEAAKHVQMVKAQRLLFVKKKQEALISANCLQTLTFVCDFAQNMY
jgi:hypothetical protein